MVRDRLTDAGYWSVGLEIRVQVTQYVSDKIRALRLNPGSVDPDNVEDTAAEAEGGDERAAKRQKTDKVKVPPKTDKVKVPPVEQQPQQPEKLAEGEVAKVRGVKPQLMPPNGYAYGNVSVLRANAMKFLPNFFEKGQVRVCFFDFSFLHYGQLALRKLASPRSALEALLLVPGSSLQGAQAQGSHHLVRSLHLFKFALGGRANAPFSPVPPSSPSTPTSSAPAACCTPSPTSRTCTPG